MLLTLISGFENFPFLLDGKMEGYMKKFFFLFTAIMTIILISSDAALADTEKSGNSHLEKVKKTNSNMYVCVNCGSSSDKSIVSGLEHVTSFSSIDLTSRYYEFVWEDMGKNCPAGVYYAVKKTKKPMAVRLPLTCSAIAKSTAGIKGKYTYLIVRHQNGTVQSFKLRN
ncbi:hypothetical protein NW354_003241 [Salmonella enterica]|nr:hypothetical protein [Salmonella enterica]EAP2761007.1 hypothetical protein [Salmonella enterica]EAP3948999.1 hypothetical protein [Salmonella enterica]EAQ8986253.1 hypothetical protein [Salmonella enterica]EAS6971609.1 hypothetical protein [Salmonella enterica]